MLFFVACNNEDALPEASMENGRTLSLSVAMPGDNPTTRVDLKQKHDKSIKLKWAQNDILHLVFVQGGNKIPKEVRLFYATDGNLNYDRTNAQFTIDIPDEITDGEFDLYGIHGGGGLSSNNPTDVILPTNPGDATSLSHVDSRKDVMLYFASKNIDATNPETSVMFQHLGSLFSITLNNTGTSILEDISEARLVGVNNTGNENWAYNSDEGGQIFDLEAGEFKNTQTAGNQISFKPTIDNLSSGESMTFWGWYPPLPDKVWPELELELISGLSTISTINTKPAREAATAAGRNYYLSAEWNGAELKFVDQPDNELKGEELSFTAEVRNGYDSEKNITISISTDFDGIYEVENIEAATWLDVTDKFYLPIETKEKSTWGPFDISEYSANGEPVYLSISYNFDPENTRGGRNWIFTDFLLYDENEDLIEGYDFTEFNIVVKGDYTEGHSYILNNSMHLRRLGSWPSPYTLWGITKIHD